MANRLTETALFEQPSEFTVLPREYIQKLNALDTTPTVRNVKFFIARNTVASTITEFKKGSDGQRIHILGDGFTTIAHNTKIKTNTAANKLLAANRIYVLTNISEIWYEDA